MECVTERDIKGRGDGMRERCRTSRSTVLRSNLACEAVCSSTSQTPVVLGSRHTTSRQKCVRAVGTKPRDVAIKNKEITKFCLNRSFTGMNPV